VSYRASD
jgi:predicted site-specific integrase-resolvase